MSRKKKDVQKAIRNLQLERGKIDRAIQATEVVSSYLRTHYIPNSENMRTEKYKKTLQGDLYYIEKIVREMTEKIKNIRKTQKDATRYLVRAVEKMEKSTKEPDQDCSLNSVLRRDVRIQEWIELRNSSFDRLFKRFLTYIRFQRKKIGPSWDTSVAQKIKEDTFKAVNEITKAIHDELIAEKETIGQEINKLSSEIDTLE